MWEYFGEEWKMLIGTEFLMGLILLHFDTLILNLNDNWYESAAAFLFVRFFSCEFLGVNLHRNKSISSH